MPVFFEIQKKNELVKNPNFFYIFLINLGDKYLECGLFFLLK